MYTPVDKKCVSNVFYVFLVFFIDYACFTHIQTGVS